MDISTPSVAPPLRLPQWEKIEVVPGSERYATLWRAATIRSWVFNSGQHHCTYQQLMQDQVVVSKKTFEGDGLEIIEKPGAGTIQKLHYPNGGDGSLFAM